MMTEDTKKTSRTGVAKKLRSQFLTGILIVVPITLVIVILVWLFSLIQRIMQPLIDPFVGHHVGIIASLIAMIVLIYVVGLIGSSIGGARLINWGESLVFGKIPVVRQIYGGIKKIIQAFSTPKASETGFMEVVLVEFPRKGMKTIALVTNESYQDSGEKLLNIFIPTTPMPTSGYLEIVRESDVIHTDLSIEDALEMVVSAGKVTPEGATKKIVYD